MMRNSFFAVLIFAITYGTHLQFVYGTAVVLQPLNQISLWS